MILIDKKMKRDKMKENLRKLCVLIIRRSFLIVLTHNNSNLFNSKLGKNYKTLTLMKYLDNSQSKSKKSNYHSKSSRHLSCNNNKTNRIIPTRKTKERRRRDKKLNSRSKSRKCYLKMAFKLTMAQKQTSIQCWSLQKWSFCIITKDLRLITSNLL